MLVALDLTGDVISYAYCEGNEIVSEKLNNTMGFRTKDLFLIDGLISGLLGVTKTMIECTGITITETIIALPAYCSYAERDRLKRIAAECGIKIRSLIRGSFALALQMFQQLQPEEKKALLCSVHSDYTEFLLFQVGGDVVRVQGSAILTYDKGACAENPAGMKQRVLAELKALYGELGLSFEDKEEDIYITSEEKDSSDRETFAFIMESVYDKKAVHFPGDTAKGAFYHLMKLMDFCTGLIRKCFSVDCSTEGISISSGVTGELKEVFRRNSELPAKKEMEMWCSRDNVLCFYAGNYMTRENDDPIGTCRIPEAYRGQNVYLKITLTEDGIVEYVVLDAKRQIIYPRQVLH